MLTLGLQEGLVECATVCIKSEVILTCNFTSVSGSSEQSLQRGWLFPLFAAFWHKMFTFLPKQMPIDDCLYMYIYTCNFTSVKGFSEQSLQRGWLFPPFAALWHNKMPCQHGDCSRHVSHKRTGVEYNFSPDHNWLRSFLNF